MKKTIQDYENALKKANENIKELTDKLKDPASGLYKELLTKDTKIKEYAAQVAKLQETNAELYQKLFKTENNVHNQLQEAIKLAIADKVRIISEHETIISQLKTQIEKSNSVKNPNDDALAELITANEKLNNEKQQLELKVSDINKLKKQLDTFSKELDVAKLTIKERDKTIQMNEELLNECLKEHK